MGEPDLKADAQWVDWIRRRGLVLPALVLLEMARPFGFIASQGLLLCQPLLGYLVPEAKIVAYADLLADRQALDRLIARFEGDSRGGEERE